MSDTLSDSYLYRRRVAELESSPTLQLLREQGQPVPVDLEPELPPAPTEPAVQPSARRPSGVVRDVGTGLAEVPTQVLGGARDAIVQTGKAIEAAGDWLREQSWFPSALNTGKVNVRLPEIGAAQSVTGDVVRSASQFLTGFLPFMKATKAIGLTTVGIRGAAAGAATDFTVFDPHQKRLSNLVNELAPALKNPVTEYLAADPADSEAEGRLKNTLEGLGIGALAEGVARGATVLRNAQTASKIGKAEKAAAKTGGTALAEEPVLEAGEKAMTFGELSQEYQKAVDVQRRGKRTHAQAAEEGAELGMTAEDVKTILPGTAMNDAEAVATVKVLEASGRRLKTLAVAAKTGDEPAVREMLTQLYEHAEIDPKRLGVIAESGRTLSVMNEPISGVNQFLAQFEQLLRSGYKGMTGKRLAEMVDALLTPEQLTVFARNVAKPGMLDAAIEAWTAGLLWSPLTHARNTLANAVQALWAIPERALASRIGSGEVAKGEATAMLYGMVEGFGDALRLSWQAMKTGEPASGLSKLDMRPRRALTGETLGLTGTAGRAVDILGETMRGSFRALMAEDEFFRATAYRMELRAQALREGMRAAESEGLTGAARSNRVADVAQSILADAPLTVREAAEKFGAMQTFTQSLSGSGQALMALRDTHPAFRIVMPFVKTPVNIATGAISRTPLAPLLQSFRNDYRAGGARKDLAMAQLSLGSMVLATFGVLAAQGLVTGAGPKEPNVKREWLETHQPYSLKLGDKWFSFNWAEPIGMVMGLGADFSSAAGHMDSLDAEDLAAALAGAVAKNITSRTWIRGAAESLHAISDPDRYAKTPLKSLAGTAIPFSGLVGAVERTVDPTLREARTLLDQVISRIPGLSSTLPPRRNLWGEPIVLEGGLGPDLVSPIYTKSAKADRVSEEIVRNEISLSMPPRSIARIELTPAEHDRFVLLAGKEVQLGGLGLKDRLEKFMGSSLYQRLTDGPDEGKARFVKSWVQTYRQEAQRRLLQEFPELAAAVREAERQHRNPLTRTVAPDLGAMDFPPETSAPLQLLEGQP